MIEIIKTQRVVSSMCAVTTELTTEHKMFVYFLYQTFYILQT